MALVKCKSALLSLESVPSGHNGHCRPLPSNPIQPLNLDLLEVWQGRDKQTNEKVAVKFEDSANVPHLSGSVAIHHRHKDSSGHALQLEHEQHVLK